MKDAFRIGAGHTFVVYLKDSFPINFLNAIKGCQESARSSVPRPTRWSHPAQSEQDEESWA